MEADVEVIVVGAGPAGLSAALVLGRACREVLVIDHGRPRNAVSHAVHGFLTREGLTPADLRRLGRQQLATFPKVRIVDGHVVDASCRRDGGIDVTTADGERHTCRRLVIATGVVDILPEVEGVDAYYGRGLFHCPFCDGWEVRDQGLAAYGCDARGPGLALELLNWSDDVVLCTDGAGRISTADRDRLTRYGVAVIEDRVRGFTGDDLGLRAVTFETRPALPRAAVFFSLGQRQASPLAERLGCQMNRKGTVDTARHESTNVPGVYVVGDASRNLQWVALAAAEGAEAAFAIVQGFLDERLR